jgi:hypothetical protein
VDNPETPGFFSDNHHSFYLYADQPQLQTALHWNSTYSGPLGLPALHHGAFD